MENPILNLPSSMQAIIKTLQQEGLSQACYQFLQLGPWCDIPWSIPSVNLSPQPSQEAANIHDTCWLFCCYFDAHLFCTSHAEWMLISQRLRKYLESTTPWLMHHAALIDILTDIESLAVSIHSCVQSNESIDLPDSFQHVIDVVKSSFSEHIDFRIPVHELIYQDCSGPISSFIDLQDLYNGCSVAPGDLLCSSSTALCLALKSQKQPFLEKRQIFCVGGTPPSSKGISLSTLKLSTDLENRIFPFIKDLEQDSKNCPDFETSYNRLIKFIDNEARSRGFTRYGAHARLPLLYRFQLVDWYQYLNRRDISLSNDPLPNQLRELCFAITPQQQNKTFKKLPRIVHICSQLVDEMHAPSKILLRIVSLADSSQFDTAVVVTDSLVHRPADYPTTLRHSPSSLERGKEFLKLLQQQKTSYYIDHPQASDSLETSCSRILNKLLPLDIDILIFHGPEPLHYALAKAIQGPKKVLFKHGTLPQVEGFDHIICSLEDTPTVSNEQLQSLHCTPYVLPYFSDARWTWEPNFPTKAELYAQEDDLIATTISNHLWTRLTPIFCKTISEILRRCPRIVYRPIGPVNSPWHEEQMLLRFDSDVRKKIRFLGSHKHPSQLTRCMDWYFNEFPFGGCLSILDAMASGCVVISMYDPKGPPQARYGGLFTGLRHAITSCDPRDYVEKVCTLYHDPLQFFIVSQQIFQEFEWRSNLWAYTKKFEDILCKILKTA